MRTFSARAVIRKLSLVAALLLACDQDPSGNTKAGQILHQANYLPCGKSLPSEIGSSAAKPAYTFTSYEEETALSLLDAGARFHSPSLCRFLSVDPVDSPGSSYRYASNNFLNRVDPDGRQDGPKQKTVTLIHPSSFPNLQMIKPLSELLRPEEAIGLAYSPRAAKFASFIFFAGEKEIHIAIDLAHKSTEKLVRNLQRGEKLYQFLIEAATDEGRGVQPILYFVEVPEGAIGHILDEVPSTAIGQGNPLYIKDLVAGGPAKSAVPFKSQALGDRLIFEKSGSVYVPAWTIPHFGTTLKNVGPKLLGGVVAVFTINVPRILEAKDQGLLPTNDCCRTGKPCSGDRRNCSRNSHTIRTATNSCSLG